MTTIETVILVAAAVFGVANLVAYQDGPADALRAIRIRAGAYRYAPDIYTPGGKRVATALGRLVGCPYCVGLWADIAICLLAYWHGWFGAHASVLACVAAYGVHAFACAIAYRPQSMAVRITNLPSGGNDVRMQ